MYEIKCSTCANAIFNPRWCEYRCKITGLYIYVYKGDCTNYKEGKPKINKEKKGVVKDGFRSKVLQLHPCDME